jgi:hypothetical protein
VVYWACFFRLLRLALLGCNFGAESEGIDGTPKGYSNSTTGDSERCAETPTSNVIDAEPEGIVGTLERMTNSTTSASDRESFPTNVIEAELVGVVGTLKRMTDSTRTESEQCSVAERAMPSCTCCQCDVLTCDGQLNLIRNHQKQLVSCS